MRTARFISFAALLLIGCAHYDGARGKTTTVYTRDTGLYPADTTTITQTYDGASYGVSTDPFGMMMLGGAYGYGGMSISAVGGQGCILYPDRCAAMQIATVYQPTTVSSYPGYGGGRVGPSGAGTYGPGVVEDKALSEMLAKHEKALSALAGQTRQNARQLCQIVIASPESIKDEAERADLVASCTLLLAKPTTNASANAAGKEKK